MTVRRLNRIEYRNTVRDLVGVDYDTTSEFPPDDTGHGFFSPDRPSYRVAAANDGWERVEDFFATNLGS